MDPGPPRAGASGGRSPCGSPARSVLLLVAAFGLLASSCAYYNTFYLAKRYYTTATAGLPYPVDKPTGAQTGNYQKSIDLAKKVIAHHPKSKWVDDAYLMWAQALLGKEDPLQTVNMLQDFPTRYPGSSRRDEATFYLGVAHRQARKYREALVSLDEYLEKSPNGELAPYAYLERSRALMSLNRPTEAAEAAGQVIERFPENSLVVRARAARAEALLAGGDPAGARRDFQALGLRAVDDNERFSFLLREADCLEAARDHASGLELLTAARSHEQPPTKSATGAVPTVAGGDRYGQLTLRIGTLHLLAGRSDQALAAYQNVIQDYPKTPLAAEAQFRIGYSHETALDDFDAARLEYAKVRDHSTASAFFAQATQRQQSLDRLARFRSAGVDSSDRKVEAGFLLAEQYLFQLDKPERALETYAEIAREHEGTAAAAKAMNAEAWVLRRKLERPAAADSLLWRVVREYPATEAQLAARDYLESEGQAVPAGLIKLPEREMATPDTTLKLTPPPSGPMPLGAPQPPAWPVSPASTDSLAEPQVGRPSPTTGAAIGATGSVPPPTPDATGGRPPGPSASPRVVGPFGEPSAARPDSMRPAVADTTRRAAADSTSRAPADTTRRRWVPTDTTRTSPR